MNKMNKWFSSLLIVAVIGFSGCSNDEASYSLEDINPTSIEQSYDDAFKSSQRVTVADVYVSAVKDVPYEQNLARNVLNENGTDTYGMTDKEVDELVTTYIYNKMYGSSASTSPALSASRSFGIIDLLGDILVDSGVMSLAFNLVLNDTDLTMTMIKLAIANQETTDIMVKALDKDWDLTKKMYPMLEQEPEFGRLFTNLCWERPSVTELSFQKIDPDLFDAMTKSMMLNKETTTNMGRLLEKYAVEYFVIPGTGFDGTYGKTDNFSKLFFDKNNAVTNQRFFQAMFMHPESTNQFIAGFKKVNAKSQATTTVFFDLIFLGRDLDGNDDIVLAQNNIYAIVGGMYQGIETYGLDTYASGFIGFAILVPEDRYLDYGQSFMYAGTQYAAANGYSIDTITTLAEDYIFNTDFISVDVNSIDTSKLQEWYINTL